MKPLSTASVVMTALMLPAVAQAHGFGQRFTLPLPFWLYGGAACAALLLSFLALLWLRPASPGTGALMSHQPSLAAKPVSSAKVFSAPARLWMCLNTGLLLLGIVSALAGSQHAASNFSMTWFWIYLLIAFFYIAAFAGKSHVLLNPWWCLSQFIPQAGNARWPALGAWPAFIGYLLLIELELFGHASPMRLGLFLLGYTLLCIVVCLTAGRTTWLEQFDIFHGLFSHISRLWPRRSVHDMPANTAAAHPWQQPVRFASQMLIMAMLASTAFDALKESVPWATQLWRLLLTLFPQPDTNPLAILAALSETYRYAEMLMWIAMPFAYAALMACMVAISRRMAPVGHAFQIDMALAALALLPLVLGYHAAHYFPLLLSEGPNLLHLLSDPLGEGRNLFATAGLLRAPVLLETDTVWHWQVVLIVGGHLGGVVMSHWQACQIHPTRRAVLLSQLPMLVWMMTLTTWGLWILSQPMKAG